MKIKKSSKNSRNKTIFTLLGILLIIALITAFGIFWYKSHNTENSPISNPEESGNTINYDSPSDEDIEHSQDAKKRGEETQPQQGDDKLPASVGIAFADKEGDNFEVRAFTSSVIEGTGTCTAVFTNGSKTVKKSSKAFVDASTSQCQPILVPLSELTPSGDWNFNVEYYSPTSSGASQIEVIKI